MAGKTAGDAAANVLAWRAWRAQQSTPASLTAPAAAAAAAKSHGEIGGSATAARAVAAAAATRDPPSSQNEMLEAILENQRDILAQLAELRSGVEGSNARIGSIERGLATLGLQPSSNEAL